MNGTEKKKAEGGAGGMLSSTSGGQEASRVGVASGEVLGNRGTHRTHCVAGPFRLVCGE